jgi:hypothetical protein
MYVQAIVCYRPRLDDVDESNDVIVLGRVQCGPDSADSIKIVIPARRPELISKYIYIYPISFEIERERERERERDLHDWENFFDGQNLETTT